MKKELKSGILSADKSADGRPTVFLVNVIAVYTSNPVLETKQSRKLLKLQIFIIHEPSEKLFPKRRPLSYINLTKIHLDT